MNTNILGGITFVLVFAGIILLHELGHFISARWLKIEVEEFGIGLPPRLLRLWRGKGQLAISGRQIEIPRNFDFPFDRQSALHRLVIVKADTVKAKLVLRTIELAAIEGGQSQPVPLTEATTPAKSDDGQDMKKVSKKERTEGEVSLSGTLTEFRPGTDFTLNWIPLGGFNKIKGEDDPDTPGGMAAAKPWKRIVVLMAGVTMNLLTAVVVYLVMYGQMGMVPDLKTAAIAAVEAGTPAEQAGLKADDIVLAVNDTHITGYEQLISITHANLGHEITLVVLRGDETLVIPIVPRAEYPAEQGPMGIKVGVPLVPPQSWTEYVSASFAAVGYDINSLLSLPGRIIAGSLSPEEAQVGGPRSLWNLFQQSVARDVQSRQSDATGTPTNYTLLIIISLTVTVGVANLLPIPALDGGRILMVLPEIILRRRIPAKYQMAINGVSFLVLIILLGLFYIKDLISPVIFNLP